MHDSEGLAAIQEWHHQARTEDPSASSQFQGFKHVQVGRRAYHQEPVPLGRSFLDEDEEDLENLVGESWTNFDVGDEPLNVVKIYSDLIITIVLLVSIVLQAANTNFMNESFGLQYYGDAIVAMNVMLIPILVYYFREVRLVMSELAHDVEGLARDASGLNLRILWAKNLMKSLMKIRR